MIEILVALAIFTNSISDSLWNLIDKGKYQEVLKITGALVDSGQVDRDVLLARAFAFRMQDSLGKAIAVYNEILKVNPEDYDALQGLALTLSWADELDSSISIYKRILRKYGDDREALMGIARVYGWKGELKSAREWIEKAVTTYKDADVFSLCGEIYIWSDMYDRAVECFKKSLEISPENTDILVRIGNIYEWKGDYSSALSWYKRALPDSQAVEGIRRVRYLMRPSIEVKLMPAREKDSLSVMNHLNFILIASKYVTRYLDFTMRTAYHRTGFGGDSSRQVYLIQPGIVLKYHDFKATISPGAGFTGVFYGGISFKKGPVHGEVAYSEEILEEGKMIKIKHLEFRGGINFSRFTLKAEYDRGEIPFDGNGRKIFDLNVSGEFLSRPVSLKILYSYGFKKYKFWSPDYYSPENYSLHSMGVAAFKNFGGFYFYLDASRSFSGNPETTTYSFEAGVGKFYFSFSSFITSENYSYRQLTLGFSSRI